MKKIRTTQNQVTIVDDIDYEELNQYTWYAIYNRCVQNYYIVRYELIDGKNRAVQMARMILGLRPGDKRQAHHRNHDTLDNRRENLEIVTASYNQLNRHGCKRFSCHNKVPLYPGYAVVRDKDMTALDGRSKVARRHKARR